MKTTTTNHEVILGYLSAYGPCNIEWLVKYCLWQKDTTRAAALEAINQIIPRPEATVQDGYLYFEGIGGM